MKVITWIRFEPDLINRSLAPLSRFVFYSDIAKFDRGEIHSVIELAKVSHAPEFTGNLVILEHNLRPAAASARESA